MANDIGKFRKFLRNEVSWFLGFVGIIVVVTGSWFSMDYRTQRIEDSVENLKNNHLLHLSEDIQKNQEHIDKICDKIEANNLKLERLITTIELGQ